MPRWFSGYQTRFVITNLHSVTTTTLDKLILDAQMVPALNQPLTGTFSVRSNDRRVNRTFTDGFPLLAQSNRLVYVFFREAPAEADPWVCRVAGILMSPEDQADADVPTTHFAFFDPWQFLMGTPAFIDGAGNIPGPDGFQFFAQPGSIIAVTLLKNAIDSLGAGTLGGNGTFIDAGPDYGGTSFWAGSGGVREATPVIDYVVQQGATLGQVWNDLVGTDDPDPGSDPTRGMDIVLSAIYDPINRPGYTHNLSIYNLAGVDRPASPMAWGAFTRTSITADRQHDATPGSFINVANFYAGQGGPPAGPGGLPIVNTPSVDTYLAYWASQFFPNQFNAKAVTAYAQQALTLAKQGKRTFTLNPDPLRAVPPFVGYDIGDRIPVITRNSLRVVSGGLQRVQSIPLQVTPDGITRVNGLLTSPDYRGADS